MHIVSGIATQKVIFDIEYDVSVEKWTNGSNLAY